jgi:outer membrane protein assembly factor BamE (lipoprotein component of BamABCDE complex)
VLALPLAACLYVPPVWDISDPNNKVDSIKVGETTRTQVLSLLGESPSVCAGTSAQTSRWYRYSGTHSAGRLAYAGGDPKALAETPWYLNIYFNDRGVVEAVDTNPPPSGRPQARGVTFDEGDASPPTPPPSELFLDRSCPN